jgi:hypothetical protein
MINYRQALLYLGFKDENFILQNDNDERGTFVGVWLSDLPQPTQAQIEAAHAEWEAEYNATQYQRDRAAEYPSIEELAVALAELQEGRSEMWDEVTQKRTEVKAKYPKPE